MLRTERQTVMRHDPLNGVDFPERNSHVINPRLPHCGRAAQDDHERRLAKECVGSDRARQDRSPDPEATTSRVKKHVNRSETRTPRRKQNETRGIARQQFRRTDPLRNIPDGTSTALDNLFQERFRSAKSSGGGPAESLILREFQGFLKSDYSEKTAIRTKTGYTFGTCTRFLESRKI